MGEEDMGRRLSRGSHDHSIIGDDPSATTMTSRLQSSKKQTAESPPEPKRRRAPSFEGATESVRPIDQSATTPRRLPAFVPSSPTAAAISHGVNAQQGLIPRLSPCQRASRAQRHSEWVRPETSPTTGYNSTTLGTSAGDLARLPSLSSIAQELPSTSSGSHLQSRRGLSSPNSARSQGSISSRGSSPRASSSSSSSSIGKRRHGSIAADVGTLSRSASQVSEFRYELVIHQQPGTAAAAGLSPPALSRLPIVPSPILQLRVTDGHGRPIQHRHVCSLLSATEDKTPIDYATEEQPVPQHMEGQPPTRRSSQPLAMICGTRVYSSCEAVDSHGEQGIFFIFWDTSIRQEGEYRLKFSLIEALPGSPTLTSIVSEPFTVVGRSEFPGTVEIATDWTRHMHRQGLNIYLPALGTSSGLVHTTIARP